MQNNVTPLISKILASYQEIGGINNIDGTNLPSKRAITQICEDLLQILFPGFHDEKPIATEKLPQITSGRILSIVDRLRVEAFKSLRLNEPKCPSRRADQIVFHLIGELQTCPTNFCRPTSKPLTREIQRAPVTTRSLSVIPASKRSPSSVWRISSTATGCRSFRES